MQRRLSGTMVLLLANAGLVGMPAGAADAPAADAAPWVLVNGRTLGGDALELRVEGGRIVDRGATVSREGARVADAAGGVVLPGFVDSHVHLAYLPAGAELARRGVAAAIDLAAPLDQVGRDVGGEGLEGTLGREETRGGGAELGSVEKGCKQETAQHGALRAVRGKRVHLGRRRKGVMTTGDRRGWAVTPLGPASSQDGSDGASGRG